MKVRLFVWDKYSAEVRLLLETVIFVRSPVDTMG